MSQGLYTVAEIARYLGMRPQEVARMIKEDALPAVELPSAKRPVKKVPLHGLHEWLSERHSGSTFMTVDQLAAEVAAANAKSTALGLGLLQFHYVMEIVIDALRKESAVRKEAA